MNKYFQTTILLFIATLISGVVFAAPSYNVSVGDGAKIDEHGQCRYALNSSAIADIFVSTNSLAEWQSFYLNTIPGVSWNACCTTDYYRQSHSCVAVGNGYYAVANEETRIACTNLPAGSYSATYSGPGGGANNCPYSAVTCLTDYRRPTTTTCTACTSGQYNPNANTSSTCSNCTNVPAGAQSATYTGTGGGTNNCPYSAVACLADYRRPTATTCTACTSGQYNPASNTSTTCQTCTNLPANAYSATYSGTGGGSNNCPISAVTCDATYYRNTTTSCAICNNGRYSADGNTASAATCTGACTNTVAGAAGVTYSGPGSSATTCPIGSVTCSTDYRRPTATTCAACTSGQYNPNANTSTTCSTCTNLPANATAATYSGTGGGTNNCPISSVTCDASYYKNTTTSCAACSNGRYSPSGNSLTAATCTGACTNTVAGAAGVTYSGPGTSATTCPIGSVTCSTDYRRPTATTCAACTSGQYNPNANTSTTCSSCTNKPANAYSATYSGTGGGSNNCPISAVTCNADYYRDTTTSCATCGTGTYTAANNTAGSCSACTNKPANSSYTGTGGGSNNCPWSCNSGYTQSGGTCVASCTFVPLYKSCFTAGTKVLMANGSEKSIEDIAVGEYVMTYDEKLGIKVLSQVTEALHHEPRMQPMYSFKFENGQQFTVTAEHLLYSYYDGYVPAAWLARDFNEGKNIFLMDINSTPAKVVSIGMKEESVPTYNLHVAGLDQSGEELGRGHNYYASGLLVHNAKMCEDGSSQPPINMPGTNVNCPTANISMDHDLCGDVDFPYCSDPSGCP